ncbi:SCO7613 C-terminal domain-containing membrane protein [Aeromicrobium sp. Sec7.5]|uniref:SCO7613 C-terminal domain-containing membrane protein n=1 Tax=Aeromicrobium sp. Sec7.5 TaxID=3121276 RepID=UPI002FE46B16
MRYADATRCPDCRAVLDGAVRCAVCGFDVESPEVPAIWSHLQQIDELVATARARAVVPTPTPAAPTSVPPPPAPAVAPPPILGFGSGPVAPPGPGVSAGSVVLGLGAALLVLAAVIFVSFAWSVVGVGGRAAILALLTAVVGAAGGWALHRGLRGSAEALWLVFAGFVSVDWFAACGLGLLGLDGLTGWQVAAPWWVLLSVTSALVGAASRRLADHPVVTLEVAAGLALLPVVATIGEALDGIGVRPFWLLLVLTVLASAVAVLALLLHQHVWSVVAGITAAATGAAMFVAAVVEAAAGREPGQYVGDAHGLPLLLLTVVVAASAAWRPAREASVAATTLLLALLVALPLTDLLDGQAWFVWLTLLTVVAVALRLVPWVAGGPVGTGLLIGGGVLAVIVVLGWTTGLAPILATLGESVKGPRDLPFLRATRDLTSDGRLEPWAAYVGGAGIVAGSVIVARWSDEMARRASRQVVVVAGIVAASTVLAVLAETGAPVIVLGLAVGLVGVLLVSVARWCGAAWEIVGVVVVALAPVLTVTTWDGLVAAAAASLLVLLALAGIRRGAEVTASVATFAAALWIMLLALLAVTHPDVELAFRPAVSIVLVVALLLAVVGTAFQQPPVAWRPGLPFEAVGAGAAAITLLAGATVSDAAWMAAWCTGSGVTAVAVGQLVPGRRWARWVGAGLLGLAWILRLVASDVSTVEAYTVPFALVALGIGALALRRDESLRTFAALGGGLALGLVPSTVVVLADPVSCRALLVGLVAFALVGVGLALRWQAPFVLGGAALLLISIVEIAPYGWGLPRWVLIGGAGLLLLIGGITWENRVRDGRAVARFVRSMR